MILRNSMMKNNPDIPFSKAVGMIFFSTLLVSGTAYLTWFGAAYFWSVRSDDSKYEIIAIVQTGPEKEALRTNFLAELLMLSVDRPKNLYKFDLNEGREKLLAFPLIKEASIKRIPPGTLYVDYTVRKPVAFLADLSNTALDADGHLIPFKPFFSPKKLPTLLLGITNEEQLAWGMKLHTDKSKLAFEILSTLGSMANLAKFSASRIDVSRAYAPSLGMRQVVIILEEESADHTPSSPLTRTLLLNPENIREGLGRFAALQASPEWNQWTKALLIDLRLPQLGYIQ